MRIFYITSVLGGVGGSEIYTRDLLKELLKRGHEIFIFTTSDYKLAGAQTFNCQVWGHHAFHKWQGLLYFWQALQLAKKFKPDVIQSHSNSMMGLIGGFIKWRLKLPYVLLIELISSQNRNIHTKLIFQWEKFFLPKINYDTLVVWTKKMKEKFLLPWSIEENKIEVIPAAVNVGNYHLKADGSQYTKRFGKKLITSIKGLWGTNARGLEYIIKAMKHVKRKHPDWKYVIFGWGEEAKNLAALAEKEGVSEVVKLAGPVYPVEGEKIAAATAIAPHSFVYEFSTSISLLEYMAWGKACVVTDIGAVREFVGEAALVVKAKNEKALAEGINQLIEDPKLRKKLGKKARQRAERLYSTKATVDRLEKIYRGLTELPGRN